MDFTLQRHALERPVGSVLAAPDGVPADTLYDRVRLQFGLGDVFTQVVCFSSDKYMKGKAARKASLPGVLMKRHKRGDDLGVEFLHARVYVVGREFLETELLEELSQQFPGFG